MEKRSEEKNSNRKKRYLSEYRIILKMKEEEVNVGFPPLNIAQFSKHISNQYVNVQLQYFYYMSCERENDVHRMFEKKKNIFKDSMVICLNRCVVDVQHINRIVFIRSLKMIDRSKILKEQMYHIYWNFQFLFASMLHGNFIILFCSFLQLNEIQSNVEVCRLQNLH